MSGNKRWKWILGLFAFLVAGLVAITYLFLANYDFNKLKPRIARAVREATGRNLTLDGDIKLEFGLSPSLSVEKVSFQNAPWGTRPELAKIRRLEMQIALIPLMRREIALKRLILIEPDILLETEPSGKLNFGFRNPMLPLFTFDVVRIERGILTYKDNQRGKVHSLKLESLNASLAGGTRPTELSLGGMFNGRPFEVRGNTGPLGALFAPGRSMPMKVTAGVDGATVVADGSIRDALKTKILDLVIHAEGSSIQKVAEFAGMTGVPDLGPFRLTARLAGTADRLSLDQVDFQAGSEECEMKVQGSIKDPLAPREMDLHFSVRGKDLARLDKVFGKPIPLKGAFSASGHLLSPAAKIFKVTGLKVRLGESDLNGSIDLNLSGVRPEVEALLSCQRLDLRSLWPKDEKAHPKNSTNSAARRVFSSEPLPLEVLKAIKGQIKIKCEQLLTPPLELRDFYADILVDNGSLFGKELNFFMSGGTVNGNFSLRPKGGSGAFELYLKADQLNIGSLLKELETKKFLEGKLDAEIELSGSGPSIAGWMAGLNGRTFAVLSQGRFYNKYPDLFGSGLDRSLLRLINPFRKEEEFTHLNCLVNGFHIQKGLAVCSALVLDTGQTVVVGGGEINLKDEKLNLSLQSSPKRGIRAKGLGKISMSFGELAKPVKLGGTLANPSLTMDTKGTLITFGKAVGGVALFGPAGILAVLTSASPDDQNPCLTAIEAAKKEGKAGQKRKGEKARMQEGRQG